MADQAPPLTDLELVRTPGDRRTYRLGDLGTLQITGFWGRSAVATADDGRTWRLDRTSLWRSSSAAIDGDGREAGRFDARSIARGGDLTWEGRSYELRPASSWRERYALVVGDREVAVIDGRGWGKRPVGVTIAASGLDPGLLLYVAYVVRSLAEDASGAAGGSAATVAATSGC